MTAVTARVLDVPLPAGPQVLPGTLALSEHAGGLVVCAHGSGSSRRCPRNQFVAGALQDAELGTSLIDLLTEPEAEDRRNVVDIELLADRLLAAALATS